jgi:O-acetyl-ADP-ribose deacetylase (regulator of RNase III)
MQTACAKLAPIETGEAVITPGFNLPAKYVIHAAGPAYNRRNPEESERLLRACGHQVKPAGAANNGKTHLYFQGTVLSLEPTT